MVGSDFLYEKVLHLPFGGNALRVCHAAVNAVFFFKFFRRALLRHGAVRKHDYLIRARNGTHTVRNNKYGLVFYQAGEGFLYERSDPHCFRCYNSTFCLSFPLRLNRVRLRSDKKGKVIANLAFFEVF